jgi:hypothetical protein
MHSRIFQISKTPINIEDYIDESHYYDHWFTNEIADYVNGDTVRENDIDWLKACVENRGISFSPYGDGMHIIVEDKVKYFESKFNRFHDSLKELSTVSIEEFISGQCGLSMYNLKEAYDDRFGFYVDSDETDLVTFDDFVRQAEVGAKYYIGTTIDYHF